LAFYFQVLTTIHGETHIKSHTSLIRVNRLVVISRPTSADAIQKGVLHHTILI